MGFYLLLSAIIACAYAGVANAGKCPANHTKMFKMCTQKIQVNIQSAQGHMFITDPDYTKKMCEGGEVDKAISCMETVYSDCSVEGMEDFDFLVNPKSWRSAMKEICKNKKFLKDNAGCMRKSAKEMGPCVQNFTKAVEVEQGLKQVDISAQGKKNQREVYELVCRLSDQLMTCFDKTLLKHCPKKLEKILDDVLHKFLPPICHPKTSYKTINDENSSSVSIPATVTVVVSVLMCLRSIL
ncbi:uncharacterized protein [Haliotis asinina]|uniref:uncharacterized protein n=1 Tax=Haliotis asinina TaxID=109174 RepID=UPI00353235E6